MYHKRGARVAVKQPSPQELTDLVTEAVNAVADAARDEYRDLWYRLYKSGETGYEDGDCISD